jgi:signal transduction histidine kinase
VVARHLEVLSRAEGSADGHPRHFEVRLAKMDDVFALAIVRDVTKEVAEHNLRLAAEARSLDVLKRESLTMFAAGIAHDVNNVLAVILGTVDSVSAARGETPETEVVRDAAKRGVRMMKELIEFAGDGKVSLVRLSPEFLVRDVQTILARTVGKNVAVQVSAEKGLPDVDADPNRFWKVFFNIVKNAGEALGSRPGHITLTAEAFEMTEEASVGFMSDGPLTTGPGVLFKISDDGPGISPAVLPRLFDPYVSSKEMGRGLGLAIVRTIVETHGGGLKVDSELDKGTTFSIYLPKSKIAPERPAEAPNESRGGELPSEVLVIDDDEAILKTVSMLLKALGVKAHLARDRKEAMGFIRRSAGGVGAVLLDAHIGGIDVVRLFKAFSIAAPESPVVIVSGSQEDEIEKMFGGRLYRGFLSKPFTLAELKSVLSSVRGA